MKRLKIGIFLDSYFPNVDGVVMVVDNLAKNLSKIADVTVIVPNTISRKDDDKREYKVVRIKSIKVPTTEYRLAVTLFKKKYYDMFKDFDIVHIHSPFTIGKLGILVARRNNIPVIATMHTRFDFEFRKYLKFKFLVNFGIRKIIKPYNKCDDCIAVNNALVKVFKDFGYKKDPIVKYNGTDMKIIDDPIKSMKHINELYNLSKDEIVFLFVGRIISIENIFFTLDVLKKLKDDGIKFKMLYVGIGPDFELLKNKVKEYNMEDEVILTGKITDRQILKEIYYRAKLFIFPSLFDASSLVQIEAASQKTPVLFIEGAATTATVTDKVNGFIAPNDINEYANYIIDLMHNDNKLQEVSNNCYRDLYKNWDDTINNVYDKYLKLIENKKEKNKILEKIK